MVYEDIAQRLMVTDGTVGYTIMSVAAAFLLVVFAIVFGSLFLVNYKKRSDLELWYKSKVTGYKVGIIEKAAKDEDVQIIEMKKLSVAEVAREELEEDLKRY